jgi:hypothetical protein
VGPRAGLDDCGKISPPPGFDPRTHKCISVEKLQEVECSEAASFNWLCEEVSIAAVHSLVACFTDEAYFIKQPSKYSE